jgi:serine/threonine protein kinase/Flp pilus assembly protein TadD
MDQAPDMVGPYRILRLIGAGGMGRVYLAEDTRLFRHVALKRIATGEDKKAQERLFRESRAAARLNHPGIASVHDILELESAAYIVMEYVPGETLDRRLNRGALDVSEVLRLALQITDALAEAHRLGVIHRDLKPANIAVTDSGKVKILDFGLAKALIDPTPSSSRASAGDESPATSIRGSPPYVPPEHFLGKPIRRRGDIYSLGITLFELLTGRRPFVGRDSAAIMVAVLTGPTPSVRDFRPDVPAVVDELVRRAMARKPEERPASVEELRDEIEEILARLSTTTSDMPPRLSASYRGKVPRGRKALAVATVVALATAAAIGMRMYRESRAGSVDTRPIVTVMPLTMAGSDPQATPLGVGIADVLRADLSKLEGVTVISAASLPPDKLSMDPATVARQLGATAAVSGSLQKVGDRIRLVIQITRPHSNALAWSESFDGSVDDIFALQGQVALAVAEALSLRMSSRNRAKLKSPATTDPQAFADYSLGISLYERWDIPGNLDRAIDALTRATARDPRFARAHATAGAALWRRYLITKDRQWAEKARDTALEALRLDPDDVDVECTLARIYIGIGRLDEAAEELNRAIADHPNSDLPHQLLGKYLLQAGKRDQAIAEIQKAIAIRPNYWSHYMELGTAYYTMGRYDAAAAAFQKVTELAPDNSWGFQMLGTVQHAKGNRPGAIANYKRAIALAPNPAAYNNLGALYYEEGRYQEAASAYVRAVELDPNSATKLRNLGDLYRKLGRESDATQSYTRARDLLLATLSLNPKDAEALASLGVCEAKLGDRRSALNHAAAAVGLRPDNAAVLFNTAVIYALAGRRDDGLRMLGNAVRAGYSTAWIEADENVATLRRAPEYKKVIAAARKPDPFPGRSQ